MNTEDEATILKIADLWLNQNYSPFDIGQALSLSGEHVAVIIRTIDKLEAMIKVRLLERVRKALEL